MKPRAALTLVETLVVIGIMTVLLGLLAPAVMSARNASVRLQSMNNLKQIGLAAQDYASDHSGNLPHLWGEPGSFYIALFPYLEGRSFDRAQSETFVIKVLLSPADPTLEERAKGDASYAINAYIFNSTRPSQANLSRTFRDGTSHTVLFAEHYSHNVNGKENHVFGWYESIDQHVRFSYEGRAFTIRRPTFADEYLGDVYPVKHGDPPATVGSVRGLTFQVRPTPMEFDSRLAQTPHSSGMLVGLADGSVRSLAPKMSENTYWAAVTPAGNDALGNDW